MATTETMMVYSALVWPLPKGQWKLAKRHVAIGAIHDSSRVIDQGKTSFRSLLDYLILSSLNKPDSVKKSVN
jgi:hypothetical protein